MSPTPRVTHTAREYNLGLIWAHTTFILLLVIMTWYAGNVVPIERTNLLVFLGWLHVVPVGALLLYRILG